MSGQGFLHSAGVGCGRGVRALALTVLGALWLAACSVAAPIAASGAEEGARAKRIALSFDDIPRHGGALMSREERVQLIIATLADRKVKQAVFFLTPGNLERMPEGEGHIARYVAAGHVIANHTWSHPHLSEMEAPDYLADIDRAEDWLRGRPGYRPWFRYPFLDEGRRETARRDAVFAGLAERGLSHGYVTVDASDWFWDQQMSRTMKAGEPFDALALRDLFVESHVGAANFYDGLARRTLGRSPAHVMLLHEADLTAMHLGALIDALRADGWTIISADEAYADPIAGLVPRVPSAQGTLVELLAWERGMPAPRWYDRNDTKVAQRLYDERVLGRTRTEPETQ
ncbi:polysaccharide deacetylase family protein [Paraurantiacibacter namhicola]|uniref:Chitooligosaccharide deacetylase n=1 Tax=Paraurantiacibacter namhicola TaxID=645517 RepID=A0A1C7D789_9SPHN|nr:polysaccharide deacetylase family protein [Paraurantiacibacter namhicola]ANU07346.1 Peptidoglycan-N-acetylmuramic acid deacetylase PdaC [Paraurantiacibacter namhicola]